MSRKFSRQLLIATVVAASAQSAQAAIYWDGSTNGSWNDVTNWSTVIGGGSDPALVPGSADDVILNAATVTNQLASLGVAQAAQSITVNTATAVTITDTVGLSLGSGGVTVQSGAGAFQINTPVTLASGTNTQTWANYSANDARFSPAAAKVISGAGQSLVLGDGTSTGRIILGSTGGNNEVTNTYGGVGSSTTIKSGVVITSLNDAFGSSSNKLYLQGGQLIGSSASSRTFAQATEVNGTNFTLGVAGGRSFLFNNAAGVKFNAGSAQTLTVLGDAGGRNTTFGGGGMVLEQNLTINGLARLQITGGITVNANRDLTINQTGATGITGALVGSGFDLTLKGTSTSVFVGNGAAITANVTGANAPRIVVDGPTVVFNRSDATFSGGVKLVSGTLTFSASSIGAVTSGPIGTGTLTLAGGTVTNNANGGPFTVANPVAATGGSTTFLGLNDQPLNLTGGLTVTGSTTFTFNNQGTNGKYTLSGASSLGSDLTVAGTGNHEFAGQFTVSGTRTITSTNNNAVFTGGFTSTGSLTFAGGLTSINGGTSDHSGSTTINNGATVRTANFNSAGGVNVLSASSVYNIDATGKLDLYGFGNTGSGGRSQTIGGLTGTGTVENSNSAGGYGDAVSKLVINTNGSNTWNGTISLSNGIRVVIQGTGIQNFATPNTYQDGTTVNAGTLLVNNLTGSGTGSGAVTVASGATLGGSGTISGATTISGSLQPGNSIGTLSVTNDVIWNGGDNWIFELGTASASLALADTTPSDNDLLNITGATSDFLKNTGTSWTFDFDGGGTAGFYKLVDWTTGTTNFLATDFTATNLASGLTAAFIIDGPTSALYLELTGDEPAIPEPASLGLLALGSLALVSRRRRSN